MLQASLRIHNGLGDLLDTMVDLCRFAAVLASRGRPATSACLLASFEAHGEEIGFRRSKVTELNKATLDSITTQLDDAAFAEAWEQGRKLTVREAVAFALGSETEQADSATPG